MLSLPPLSLYIHVPWCVRKCPYCDFNSHESKGELPEQQYIDALLEDLKADSNYIQGRKLHSIFIGGGTPSLFSAEAYEKLFSGIQTVIPFSDNIEITLEANPGTVEQGRFVEYRRIGINRLSIGIQSFAPEKLKALGRIHSNDEAIHAAEQAREAGFNNFNLDLMFGLPEQSTREALNDLKTAIALKPTHISWYQLTLEPNTVFHRYPPALPEDDLIFTMQETGQALLASHGYQHYETSAYTKEGYACQHNLNYWRFGDYLGIGAGAHGKLTLPEQNQIIRTRKSRQPDHYLNETDKRKMAVSEIDIKELPLEFMMNVMRLSEGGDKSLFESRTNLEFTELLLRLEFLRNKGLVLLDCENFRPTPRGKLFLNEILQEFVPET